MGALTADLIGRARSGDGEAFGELIGPYRRELQVHCYRILGSAQDAEDAMQETLLAAWQGLDGFQGRASVRTWLYRVATSRCLNALRSARRRPAVAWPLPGVEPPAPTRLGEVPWLEPYPDLLLEGLADTAPGPETRYEAREAISLAFVAALQLLPPRQRAVLILRDVLGFRASEVAGMLDASQESVTSALKRARATMARQLRPPAEREPPPPPGSASEQELVVRLTRAYDAGDVDGLVALLTDDVVLAMPPVLLEHHGRELAARFHAAVTFREGRTYRLVATRANGQPAFGGYVRDRQARTAQANGLLVLTLAGRRICAMTRFDNSVLDRFGLPTTLPD
jgi:RNA polymerase sigma-70 factor (TIGR02960 family)